jgi:hypothetical protein
MQKLKPLRRCSRYWYERMLAENGSFIGLHGKARASALWLVHVIIPPVVLHTSSRFVRFVANVSNVDIDSWLVNAFTQTEGEHDTHVKE